MSFGKFYYSEFIPVVLFMADIDGQVIPTEDMPALNPLTDLPSPYEVLDIAVGSLRRYRMTMSVHFNTWITRQAMPKVIEGVRLTLVDGLSESDAG